MNETNNTKTTEKDPSMSRQERKLQARLLKNFVPGGGSAIAVAKDAKKVKVRAMVYPSGGGQPYEEDVQVADDGTFTLKDSSLTFYVSKGSVVRCLDGIMRVVVREDHGTTININSLAGENVPHPMIINGIAKNNYWQQWGDFLNRKAFWRQAGTWGMVGIGLGLIGALVWQIKTTGSGFEDLAEAIKGLGFGSAGGSGGAAAQEAGHNAIAPGGR